MRNGRYKRTNRNTRHILIVVAIVVLVFSVGAVVFALTNPFTMINGSKKTMGKVNAPASSQMTLSSLASKTGSSEPSSLAAQSSASSAASSRAASSLHSGASSTAPLMDPSTYQSLYPNLYAEKVKPTAEDDSKVVYLTFDDGPSNLTIPLLDVLDRYKVKASFFLVGKPDDQSVKEMKEIVNRGHAIGVHSYTHQYNQIYATPAAFLDDFAKMHDLILSATGVDTHIYRFAGGSVNSYNKKTAKAIITEMNRRGYVYYDWNVSSGDAEQGETAQSIYSQTIKGVHGHRQSVILFHNTKFKAHTLSQIPKIIETLQKEGYRFATLDPTVDNKPYIFRVPS
jgi:peptidoglycan/xylan/chitin deacetylase (PgdA/CDA1 family)